MSDRASHKLLYDLKVATAGGVEFQSLFERVMVARDSSFVRIKPSGPKGDWKSDGYSSDSGTIFQCYAPETLRIRDTIAKIESDLQGAIDFWGERLKRWTFVVNKNALPAEVVSVLEYLRTARAGQVAIDWITPEGLWRDHISLLSTTQLDEVVGRPPSTGVSIRDLIRRGWEYVRAHDDESARTVCNEVIRLTSGQSAHAHDRADAYQMLAHVELQNKNPSGAIKWLDSADGELMDGSPASFRINGHRLRAACLDDLGDHRGAIATYSALLEVAPGEHMSSEEQVLVGELRQVARADLILASVRRGRVTGLEKHADIIDAFIRAHPSAQDGYLILHGAEALIALGAKTKKTALARKMFALILEVANSQEQAIAANGAVQRIIGKLSAMGSSDLAVECALLGRELALRTGKDESYWAAQANVVAANLNAKRMGDAREEFRVLEPVLRNDQLRSDMKAGLLSLAAAVLAESGDPAQAAEVIEKAQTQIKAAPRSVAHTEFERGKYLNRAGRADEALEAFKRADQLARQAGAPGEMVFSINVQIAETAADLAIWDDTEKSMAALKTLPRGREYVRDVLDVLRNQIEGSRKLRARIGEIRSLVVGGGTRSLLEGNAEALNPLLAWWEEYRTNRRRSDEKGRYSKERNDAGSLSVLYDYWGGGSAAKLIANLRHHGPDHFTPFIEVRTLQEVRRSIRTMSLVSDCVVLLWKGRMDSGLAVVPAPFDYVCGGEGYIAALGDVAWTSKQTGTWCPVLGHGPFLPSELIRFLSDEALPLLKQGRLIVLPAQSVGCFKDAFGPSEHLLSGVMAATPLAQMTASETAFPLGVLPFFEDVPFPILSDLLESDFDAPRRLRRALIKRTIELRAHGAEAEINRDIADEIADALAALDDSNKSVARRRGLLTREENLGATAIRLRQTWSPVITLRRLGYRMSLTKTGGSAIPRSKFTPEKDSPVGTWLALPGQNVQVLAARKID